METNKMGRSVQMVFIASTAALVVVTLIYGIWVVKHPDKGPAVDLALIQGNIEQSQKWDPKQAAFIMQTYLELTREAAQAHPDLIIWPESATPRAIFHDRKLYRQITDLSKTTDTPILFGSAHPQKFKRPGAKDLKFVNSAFLITPAGNPRKPQRYDKIRLFPFGEYLPYENIIPWELLRISKFGDYQAGDTYTLFEHSGYKFGVTICWENLFPQHVRQFVLNGAQFMVNMTNEAWFGKTAAPYQFTSMSVMRAVENRIYMVRCTNTGISCIIDPYGRIISSLKDDNGEALFVRGMLNSQVELITSNTLYTRLGDWLVGVSLVVSLVMFCVAIVGKISKKRSTNWTTNNQIQITNKFQLTILKRIVVKSES